MNLEGILCAVNRRVAIKVELSPVVLYQFRLAAWRLNQNPSLLLRQMISSYISMADDPKSIDLCVACGSCGSAG
ncbi:hypothetical protein [uncultured Stenotrophomonas sp.]|uniref:hypothetical protein n=1 Tax=uncultured Stenotrophomonas sp. TaxID=165438 RepID=UPI0028EE1362|nr:hypothetical protein [uncultured Stenotrophomonas sp.]